MDEHQLQKPEFADKQVDRNDDGRRALVILVSGIRTMNLMQDLIDTTSFGNTHVRSIKIIYGYFDAISFSLGLETTERLIEKALVHLTESTHEYDEYIIVTLGLGGIAVKKFLLESRYQTFLSR